MSYNFRMYTKIITNTSFSFFSSDNNKELLVVSLLQFIRLSVSRAWCFAPHWGRNIDSLYPKLSSEKIPSDNPPTPPKTNPSFFDWMLWWVLVCVCVWETAWMAESVCAVCLVYLWNHSSSFFFFFFLWNCNYFDKQSLYSAGVPLTSCKISTEVVHYRGKSIIMQTLAKLMSCLKIINVFLCLGSLSEKTKTIIVFITVITSRHLNDSFTLYNSVYVSILPSVLCTLHLRCYFKHTGKLIRCIMPLVRFIAMLVAARAALVLKLFCCISD